MLKHALFLFSFISISLLSNAQTAVQLPLLCNWNDTSIKANLSYTQKYNDVWGFEWKGVQYAAIGSTEGVHIIDIQQCKQVAFKRGTDYGNYIIHRDYKTFKNYLYAVCDEGYSALQIFDYSYLPDSIHMVYESSPAELMRTHNIFIDTVTEKLYCGIFTNASGVYGLGIFDLKNPTLPNFLKTYTNPFSLSSNYAVHDMYVRNDTAFLSESFFGYSIVDFKNTIPVELGILNQYIQKGYNHSSWINKNGIGVMADETHGSPLKVIDVRNVTQPSVLSTFISRSDSTCIPHNPYVIDDLVFISYYFDGFQLYSIKDPNQAKQIAYYPTCSVSPFKGFAGAWGCYPFFKNGKILVSDMQNGLFVLDAKAFTKELYTQALSVKIAPNPFQQSFQIISNQSLLNAQINIFTTTGSCIYSTVIRKEELNNSFVVTLPSSLPSELYFIEVKQGNTLFSEKIIKQ
jgi:choice-of-anchor B domain-containing protein